MKKFIALLLASLLLLSVTGCTSSYNSKKGGKSNSSNVSGTRELTISQKEKIAEEQAIQKMVEYMQLMKSLYSEYYINATEYQIGSITNSGDDFTVSGTLKLYDKYGSLADIATFSSKVTVKDNGEYDAYYPTITIK